MDSKFDPVLRDAHYWREMNQVFSENDLNLKFISKNSPVFTMRRHLAQYLAYYELFKRVVDLPGSIAEFGVFWGSGLFTWLDLMELFLPTDRGRKIFGFDDFKGYRKRSISEIDLHGVEFIEKVSSTFNTPTDAIKKLIRIKNSDNLVPNDPRVVLYEGDIEASWNKFIKENSGVRFSLINIDFNLYLATQYVLEKAVPLVVPGGVIILRGYGVKPWEGESRAVDEFLSKHPSQFRMKNIRFNNTPNAYLVKI
ncbi:TylF/MycF/NovP-related O-methyltransferase [Prochlorococcus sp. MIT 1303]|uniref:TylF/MycF/NovP-related O-methyltransferase n=1 Tax=Prochlorococcus sp. MIT 1303 TaxID=1723647 RepID=UPI0007BC07AA|nr:TylF/MycF/NovP-related O-methyltransferase [Prochlorococcus sp. MIT 1303]KZR70345.1 hypothetical protein PMIT1303_00006 [Prochlorococcus sp. MIT 1303]